MDNASCVLVGFTALARTGLVTRNQASLDFRILRFSPNGKLELSLSLPTQAETTNGIYLSDTGVIIAKANDSLQYLQDDDGNFDKGVWKTLCTGGCGVSQSPTRHTLVFHTKNADPPLTFVRFSPQIQLQQCGKARQPVESDDDRIQNYTQSITDKFVYFYHPSPEGVGYRWPICDYARRVELRHGGFTVLHDKSFVTTTRSLEGGKERWGPEVISLDGQVKFRPTLSEHELSIDFPPIRGSALGNRMAVNLATMRGGNRILDIGSHATARRMAVYDIEGKKEIASIPLATRQSYRFEFDLSPDGHHLAILEDDIIRLIDVP